MNKGLEALERNRNFIERYFVKQVEETGVYHKNMKDDIFNDLSIIKKELNDFEWIKSKINIDFFYQLPSEDREKLAEILGVKL